MPLAPYATRSPGAANATNLACITRRRAYTHDAAPRRTRARSMPLASPPHRAATSSRFTPSCTRTQSNVAALRSLTPITHPPTPNRRPEAHEGHLRRMGGAGRPFPSLPPPCHTPLCCCGSSPPIAACWRSASSAAALSRLSWGIARLLRSWRRRRVTTAPTMTPPTTTAAAPPAMPMPAPGDAGADDGGGLG